MSTINIRETLLREVSILPADYCPKVLHFIETLKEGDSDDDCENWGDAEWEKWLRLNPPIPVEDDPYFTPEHLERLRRQEQATNEGRNKVITFDDDEWEEFWQEVKHSPEQAIAKAKSRAHYLTPKQP